MREMKNLFKARWMTSLIFLILLFVITGIAAPGFLTYDNIITCFNTATMYTMRKRIFVLGSHRCTGESTG